LMLTTLPILITERLALRPFDLADAPAVQVLASAPEIADTTLGLPYPYPEDGAAAWIGTHPASVGKGLYPFAMVRKQDNVLLGTMSIGTDPRHNKGELAYWVGVPHWNQGYATEAARRVVQWAFEDLGLNRIFARYLVRNPASGRVMNKAGLVPEGTFVQDVLKWGVYEDVGQCGLVQAEYQRLTNQAF